jgi:hypothetical protein
MHGVHLIAGTGRLHESAPARNHNGTLSHRACQTAGVWHGTCYGLWSGRGRTLGSIRGMAGTSRLRVALIAVALAAIALAPAARVDAAAHLGGRVAGPSSTAAVVIGFEPSSRDPAVDHDMQAMQMAQVFQVCPGRRNAAFGDDSARSLSQQKGG